jgi:hypothetical protein
MMKIVGSDSKHHHLPIASMVTALLLIMFLTAITSVKDDSITGDEIIYPGAGYSHWLYHRFDINYESAPLLKLWMSLPLFFLQPTIPEADLDNPREWAFGKAFFFKNNENPDQILFWCRFMIILLMIGLGWFLFWGIQRWWGTKAALLTLFFYVFSPNILAHGRLATLDFGVSAFMFVATYFIIEWLHHHTLKNAILSGIFFGFAQTAKFSALILVPILLVLLSWRLFQERKFTKKIEPWLKSFLILIFTALVTIWIVYFIVSAGMTPNSVSIKIQKTFSDHKTPLAQFFKPVLKGLNQNPLTRPLAVYGVGAIKSYNYSRGPITNYPQYLFGTFNDMGWWYYYLAGFLIKEPIAIQLLLLFSIFAAWFLRKKNQPKDNQLESSIWITLIGITLLLMNGNLNIGFRYFLPAFCFLYVIIGRYIILFWEQAPKRVQRKTKFAVIGCMLWLVGSNIFIYPAYLAYFNEWIGGPTNGYKYLVDSNIDWGQDLNRLNTWLKDHTIDTVYLDYFGQGDPSHYLPDIQVVLWRVTNGTPSGYLAVSVTKLTISEDWEIANRGLSCSVLDNIEPVARIGYSINVYDLR